jgi:putative oxidoreductase
MTNPISTDWLLLYIRVTMGVILLYYGWPKITHLASNAADFVGMGFRPGWFWGTLIAVVEVFGGVAMLVGVYAELAASLFGFQMIVGTFWKVKIKKPFTDYSYDLQLLALCVVMMALGAGRFSLATFDATIFLRWGVVIAAILVGAALAYSRKPSEA